MVKISVIIPTFNRRHVLARTLPTLLEQDLPPEEYELIFVSDGSTDGTCEFLRSLKPRCSLRVFDAPHRGAGAARNVGICAAAGELVLLLDDDLIAVPDLLRQHCIAHAGFEPQVIHGSISISPDSARTIIRHITERFYEEFNLSKTPGMELRFPGKIDKSISMLSSMVNSSMPREALLRCGGFDEQILAAEDLELGLRLWKMGLPIRCQPTAMVYELHVKSSKNYLTNQAKAIGAGDLCASRKHPEYRPYSLMAFFANTRTSKTWLRNALMRSPISPVPLLYLPLRFEKLIYGFTRLRSLFVYLFSRAERINRLRGALRAAGSWKELTSEFDRRVPALIYHHVGPSKLGSNRMWSVSREQFERQIGWLARHGYTGIKPSDWLRWRREGKGVPERAVLLTFDDAYSETAEHALPILRRYGFGAAVFVVTKRIGKSNVWDEGRGFGRFDLMTAEQIRYWAGQGIEFGAHSRTHADLTALSVAEFSDEILGSKQDLTDLLGLPVVSFAYPYGKRNDAICDLVKTEFDLAFTGEEGLNYLCDDPYRLRRTYVGPADSLFEFGLCVRHGSIKTIRRWRVKLAVRTKLKRALRCIFRMKLQ